MAESATIVQDIPLTDIVPSVGNRLVGGFDEERLAELARSIAETGVHEPAIVRPVPGDATTYELVAGERRWRASAIAGVPTLPCIVRELTDAQVLRIQIIENVQREDVHPLDEADGYARLLDSAGYTAADIASETGRSVAHVYQRLRLRELIEPARELLVTGAIHASHALLIARMPADQQQVIVEWLKEYSRARPEEAMPLSRLRERIERDLLHELHGAPFKMKDEDLVPSAGACTACAKRTGANGELFTEMTSRRKDYCTDPSCYESKLNALLARRRAEAKAAAQKPVEVSSVYDSRSGLPSPWDYHECKPGTEGAVQILIANGPDRGRLAHATLRQEVVRKVDSEYQAEQKEKAKQEREVRKVRLELRRRLLDEVIDAGRSDAPWSDVGFWRLLVMRVWGRAWNDLKKVICDVRGWERLPLEPGKSTYQRENWEACGVRYIQEIATLDELRVALLQIATGNVLMEGSYGNAAGLDELRAVRDVLELARDETLDQLIAAEAERRRRYAVGSYQDDEDADEEEDEDLDIDMDGEEEEAAE
jgi:ParB/RepB/Spo0J family partition protein